MAQARTDWTRGEVEQLYRLPLMELVFRAAAVHREFHATGEVQVCTLLSIKTGRCPEDCAYCPQSAHYDTGVEVTGVLERARIVDAARAAQDAGSTRFCMGAAWRSVRDGQEFDHVLEMVREVADMGLEVCCTLGMLTDDQARRLKEAGLYAYNHNLDTSERFYGEIISTRSYQDRLDTLARVRQHDISVCCGGILGMGETEEDRIDLLHTLATQPEHPESVPINALIAVEGTPLADRSKVPFWEMARAIATARILMPRAMVRLSAGRVDLSMAEQAICFLAGANSIFAGEKLLTTENNDWDEDRAMFEILGLRPRDAFKDARPEHVPA
ncbi:MAG: biotin synthase BioB [Gemmatimonadetes bacterium]|nr:biotin synthase BioB [Gemmatimonadota bacterium]